MNPNNVISPKNKVKHIYRTFPQNEEGFSLAVLKYGTQDRIGIRWNGADNELGYPHSHGYATWFIIPKSVGIYYATKIGNIEMKNLFQNTTDEPLL